MTTRTHYLAAVAAIGSLAVPAAAQTAYPYGYQQQYQQVPQPYPGQPGYGYAQQGYPGYNQGYAQDPVSQIINSLLGNRYNVTERQAVSQCASAAMTQAQAKYGNRYNQGYGNNGYNRGYSNTMRVTSITDVQRRNNGLRVSGLMTSDYPSHHGNQHGYQNHGNATAYAAGDFSFRCNVDYRGQVTNVRIGRNKAYRG
jgi:hypothetical protein